MRQRRTKCWVPLRRALLERAFVLAFALFCSRTALADAVRVAVIHTARQDALSRRLCAEISAAGFAPIDVPLSPGDDRSAAQIAYAVGAAAAFRRGAAGDLELVIVDSSTGNLLQRLPMPDEGSNAELELRAVEDLRAKLVELAVMPAPRSTELPAAGNDPKSSPSSKPTRGVATTAKPGEERGHDGVSGTHAGAGRFDASSGREAFRIWLQAAVGVAVSSGGLGPGAVSRLGVRAEPARRWSISGLVILPLSAQKVSTARGIATLDVRLFSAAIGFVPLESRGFELDLGLAAGAAQCAMQGIAQVDGDRGRSEARWSGVGFADVGLSWNAAQWLRLRASVITGAAAPRPVVEFDGVPVATWGRPFASASVGLEVTPFRATGETQ